MRRSHQKTVGMLGVLLALSVTLSESVYSADEAFDTLVNARSLKCVFDVAATGRWKEGKLSVETGRDDLTLNFDSIDLKAQKARMIGNQAADDVVVLTSKRGITFLEETPIGNFTFTTVFFRYNAAKDFIAVTSRHMDFILGVTISQLYGSCQIYR